MTPTEIIKKTKMLLDNLEPADEVEYKHYLPENSNLMSINLAWETESFFRCAKLAAELHNRCEVVGWSPHLSVALKVERYRTKNWITNFEVFWIDDPSVIELAFQELSGIKPVIPRPREVEASSSATS